MLCLNQNFWCWITQRLPWQPFSLLLVFSSNKKFLKTRCRKTLIKTIKKYLFAVFGKYFPKMTKVCRFIADCHINRQFFALKKLFKG
tara:strand:- start:691 stop:951 length:261 start_codon:yes stop_codon:yes gene_type:complete